MFQALLLALSLTACVDDVAKDKTHAEVSEAKTVAPEAAATNAAATTLKIDPAVSKVHALGAKVTAKHPIVFKTFQGTLQVAKGELTGVELEVDMETLESDDDRLTKHLKNEDFFDVPNHPKATFTSTSVKTVDGKTMVEGNLTIRGTTKGVSFPATVKMDGDKAHATAEFAVDRQDFKVAYPGKADDLIQDNVVLTLDLHAM